MEKNDSNQFNLDSFIITREESFKRLPKILTLLDIISPSVDLDYINRIYDGLNKEIPEPFGKEDLLRNTSRLIDLCQALLRNFSKFIGSLIKQKKLGLPYYEGLTLSYFVDNYHIEFPSTIPHDTVTSLSFIVESAHDKIEKRVLMVLQNEQEEINSVIEKSVNDSSNLYALILTVSSNLDDILTQSFGKTIESDESKTPREPISDTDNISETKIFASNKHSIRMTIPSNTDSFDDALNCVFSWITEVELLPEKNAERWTEEGEAKLGSNNPDEAITSFNRALDLDPSYVRAIYGKGEAFSKLKKIDESISLYDKALEIEPNNPQLLNGKGEALTNLQRYEEAIEYFDKALDIAPTLFNRWDLRATALFTIGKYEEATVSYDKALEIEPNNPQLLNGKGEALSGSKKYDKAIECFDKAITIDRNYSTAWINRGLALVTLKRYTEAVKSYDRVLEINPHDKVSLAAKEKVLRLLPTRSKYILRGTIVTFNEKREIIQDGIVVIDGREIVHVSSAKEELPSEFKDYPEISTSGYIYPGLIDLHNHIVYCFLNLWTVTAKFVDRYQVFRSSRYKTEILSPTQLIGNSNTIDLLKYAESKALVAGITSIYGYTKLNRVYAAGILRSLEGTFVGKFKIKTHGIVKIKTEEEFRKVDQMMSEGDVFIYHLTDEEEYNEFKKHGLLRSQLICVHCGGINSANWKELGKNRVKLIWSPLNNLLLYGRTTDVVSAKKAGVTICLGSDCSPTGSKSLLWELKVADLFNINSLGKAFTDQELAEMVTVNPAKAIQADSKIGSIKAGMLADLVIFENLSDDPYRNLIQCTEKNLKLSIIAGRPRYGEMEFLYKIGLSNFEKIRLDSITRGLDTLEPGVEFGDITYKQVYSNLLQALAKMRTPRSKINTLTEKGRSAIILKDESKVDVDSGLDDTYDPSIDPDKIPSLALDSLTMLEDDIFFATLKGNPNIPSYISNLRNYLR